MATRTSNKNTPSLKEIAEKLGISKGAVSLALNDSKKISAATKARVRETAKKIGYKKVPLVSRIMSSMKTHKKSGFLETIVLINANLAEDAPQKYPIFSKYIKGIKDEAKELGYVVYPIWLHDKTLTSQRLYDILNSRGIRGGVIIGHIDDNILPEKFSEIWEKFRFVSAGLKTFKPTLDFISADKFLIAQHSTMRVIRSGYKRPGLVIDEHIDELVEGRFIGGFLRTQLVLAQKNRIPPFFKVAQAKRNPKLFFDWLEKYKPDAIFSLSNTTSEWLENEEILQRISEVSKLIRLERKSNDDDWVAIDKNYELVGRLAVRKLFEILNTPIRLKDINVATATIVQPHWNKNLLLEKSISEQIQK